MNNDLLDFNKFERAIDLYIAYAEDPLYLYSWSSAYYKVLAVYGKRYADLAESYYCMIAANRLMNPKWKD